MVHKAKQNNYGSIFKVRWVLKITHLVKHIAYRILSRLCVEWNAMSRYSQVPSHCIANSNGWVCKLHCCPVSHFHERFDKDAHNIFLCHLVSILASNRHRFLSCIWQAVLWYPLHRWQSTESNLIRSDLLVDKWVTWNKRAKKQTLIDLSADDQTFVSSKHHLVSSDWQNLKI